MNSSKNSNFDNGENKWDDLQWNLQEIHLFLTRKFKRRQKQ